MEERENNTKAAARILDRKIASSCFFILQFNFVNYLLNLGFDGAESCLYYDGKGVRKSVDLCGDIGNGGKNYGD